MESMDVKKMSDSEIKKAISDPENHNIKKLEELCEELERRMLERLES